MATLQEQVDALLCNAFIGVTYTVERDSELAWYVDGAEERMESINDVLLEDIKDPETRLTFKSFANKGITDVVLIRGW